MLVGITLPQFRDDPEPAIAAAKAAEAAGLDGVFVFDHLWPIGRPDRPALHALPLLGALAAETSRVALGPLVARVSLVPAAVLVHGLTTIQRMVGERLIGGLGTGDALSEPENTAFGVPYPTADVRLAELADCAGRLRSAGIRTWVGGRSARVKAVAATVADALNAWGVDAERLAGDRADLDRLATDAGRPPVELTWGGQVLVGSTPADAAGRLEHYGPRAGLLHGAVDEVADALHARAEAGATWAACAPLDIGESPDAVDLMAEVRRRLRGS